VFGKSNKLHFISSAGQNQAETAFGTASSQRTHKPPLAWIVVGDHLKNSACNSAHWQPNIALWRFLIAQCERATRSMQFDTDSGSAIAAIL
jgi:hypothetical protein